MIEFIKNLLKKTVWRISFIRNPVIKLLGSIKWTPLLLKVIPYFPDYFLNIRGKTYDAPEELLNVSYSKTGDALFHIVQNRSEISTLIEMLNQNPPRYIMEIGTAYGGTLFVWTRVATPNATIVALSLDILYWRRPFFRSLGIQQQHIHLITGNSHLDLTKYIVLGKLNNNLLDFLFIDGDHTYEGVKRDFELYAPLVKSGGLIAFHDIVKHPPHLNCHVDRFWNEIKEDYEYYEMISDEESQSMGIGVIRV